VSLAGLDDERDILEPSRRKFGAEDPDPARSTPPARDAPGLTGYQRRSAAAPAGIGVTVTAAGQDELDALCHLGGGQPAKRDRAPDELATGGRERRLELACEPRVAVHDEDIPVALGRRACSAPHLHRAPRMQLVRRVRARSDLARGRVGGPPGSCRRDGGGPPGRARRVRSPVAVSSPSGSHSSTLIRSRRTSATPPAGPCRAPRRGGSTCAFSPSAHGSAVAVGPRNQWRARAPEAGPASR
jgi:hypothetical protein